jgi:hypothetical protein
MIDSDSITIADLQSIHQGGRIGRRLASTYVNRLRKFWCPFVQSRRKCDRMCSANSMCADNIRQIVSEMHGDIKDPAAILVYRIRNHRARVSEELSAQEKEPIRRNLLGEVENKNPFELLRATWDL